MLQNKQACHFFLVSFFCFAFFKGDAQKFNFIQYSVEQGLAQSQATAIAQDSSRHLWISSLGGVSRFDGKNFINFGVSDGLVSSYNTSILIDHSQKIWIGAQNGLAFFNGSTFQTFSLNDEGSSFVSSIVEDGKNRIWVLYNGKLFQVLRKKCVERKGPVEKAKFSFIGKDDQNNLLVAFPGDAIYRDSAGEWKKIALPVPVGSEELVVRKSARGKGGGTWLLSNKGIFGLKGDSAFLLKVNLSKGAIDAARSLFQDKSGVLWLGTLSGVYKIENGIAQKYDKRSGLTDQAILDIFEDVEGNIWFASNSAGIFRFSNKRVSYWDKDDLPNPFVVGLAKDKKGRLWFGTYGGGFCSFDGEGLKKYKLPKGNTSANTFNFCMVDRGDNLWLGTLGGGLWRYDRKKFINVSSDYGAPDNIFYCATEMPNGDLFFGSPAGLYRYSGKVLQKITAIPDYVSSLAPLNSRDLLIGTSRGAKIFNGKAVTPVALHSPLSTAIVVAIVSRDGKIILGTANEGIMVVDTANNTMIHQFRKGDGLSSDFIYSLGFDKEGRLWASTGRFLDRVEFSKDYKKINVKVFDNSEGIFAAEGNQNSLLFDEDSIWFGTGNGIYRMNIDGEKTKLLRPNVFIEKVELFSKPIANKDYYDSSSSNGVPLNLHLPYRQNHLTFEFQGIHLSNPDNIRYQYYIEGLDKGYSLPTVLNSVVYSSLPPGSYTFVLRAVTTDGQVSSNTIRYPFRIGTPFYKSVYFQLLLVGCLIGLGFFIRSAQAKRKEKRRLAIEALKEEEQMKVRKRTAEDFHDDIGNKLTRINLLTEILKKQFGKEEGAVDLIDKIQENTHGLYAGTKDIIWSLNNEYSSVYDLILRLGDFGNELFHNSGIAFESKGLKEEFKNITVSSDVSRNLMMIVKEAMNNALKYSKASHVYFIIEPVMEDSVRLIVGDDGGGFDIDSVKMGYGIANMQARAKRISAEFTIHSTQAGGTEIILQFRWP